MENTNFVLEKHEARIKKIEDFLFGDDDSGGGNIFDKLNKLLDKLNSLSKDIENNKKAAQKALDRTNHDLERRVKELETSTTKRISEIDEKYARRLDEIIRILALDYTRIEDYTKDIRSIKTSINTLKEQITGRRGMTAYK
jgi:hypothetical protein